MDSSFEITDQPWVAQEEFEIPFSSGDAGSFTTCTHDGESEFHISNEQLAYLEAFQLPKFPNNEKQQMGAQTAELSTWRDSYFGLSDRQVAALRSEESYTWSDSHFGLSDRQVAALGSAAPSTWRDSHLGLSYRQAAGLGEIEQSDLQRCRYSQLGLSDLRLARLARRLAKKEHANATA